MNWLVVSLSLGVLGFALWGFRLLHRNTALETAFRRDQDHWKEKLQLIEQARQELSNSFAALSSQALERNNRSFLDLATSTLEKFQMSAQEDLKRREQSIEHLVKPISDSLSGVDQKLTELEKERIISYQGLRHQVHDLIATQRELRTETNNLVKALKTPHIRGRWGEMQLKRVVEMSGMSTHCDFLEQVTLDNNEKKLRPDMVVHLPGERKIIIDAKAPLAAYLEALEAKDDTGKAENLKAHARHVRQHILALARRDYWDQLAEGDVPEFVVLFLPGETFFAAALEQDPSLIELGIENKVILATPSTLIALLHAVAYGWKQERLSQNAREISDLGKELYKRLADMGKHLSRLGSDLNSAVATYNKTIGTVERRILPCARKFRSLDASSSLVQIDDLSQVEQTGRTLQAPELIGNNG